MFRYIPVFAPLLILAFVSSVAAYHKSKQYHEGDEVSMSFICETLEPMEEIFKRPTEEAMERLAIAYIETNHCIFFATPVYMELGKKLKLYSTAQGLLRIWEAKANDKTWYTFEMENGKEA